MSGNLFADLPNAAEAEERFETLLMRPGVRIERIVSTGQSSPPGFWFDQPEAEWVVLLKGAATLHFEDEAAAGQLAPGDWLYIAPHRRHRVKSTAPDEPTVWLAIHFDNQACEPPPCQRRVLRGPPTGPVDNLPPASRDAPL